MPARGRLHTFLPICQGCAFDGRSEDIRERKFLLFYFTLLFLLLRLRLRLCLCLCLCLRLRLRFRFLSFFIILSFLPSRRLLSKRTGAPDLCIAWPFDPCIVVKYVYNTCTMRSENSAHCTYTERTDCCVHLSVSHHMSSYCTILFVRQLLKTTRYKIIKFNIYT